MREFDQSMNKEETGMNKQLFKEYFRFQRSGEMLNAVYNTENE